MALGDRGNRLSDRDTSGSASDDDDTETTDTSRDVGAGETDDNDDSRDTDTSRRVGAGGSDDDTGSDLPEMGGDLGPSGDPEQQTSTSGREEDKPAEETAERGDMPRQTGPTGPGADEGAEEVGATDEFVLGGETFGEQELESELQQRVAQESGQLGREDIDVAVQDGEFDVTLSQQAAQQYEQGAGFTIASGSVPSVRQFSQQLEQQVVEGTEFTGKDVAITDPLGGEVVATEELQREQRAGRVSRSAEVFDRPEALQRGFESEEELLRDVDPQERTSEREAKQQVESDIEEQVGVNLGAGDLQFETIEGDEGTQIQAELTREGRKTIAQQQAVEGLPLNEPATQLARFGAGLDFEFDEFRSTQRERFYSLDNELNEPATQIVESVSDISLNEPASRIAGELDILNEDYDEFRSEQREGFYSTSIDFTGAATDVATSATTFGPPDILGETEASRQLEGEITGGTLPVFSSTAGAGGVGAASGLRTALAGATVGTGLLAAGASAAEGAPQTRTGEVAISESGEFFPQDEAGLPSRPGFFEGGVPVPDPTERDVNELGVPEEGITIQPGEDTTVTGPEGVGIGESVTATELELPDAETTGGDTGVGPASTSQLIGSQEEKPLFEEEEEQVTTITREDLDFERARDRFSPMEPSEGVDIGEGEGTTRQVGRQFDRGNVLQTPEEMFLSFQDATFEPGVQERSRVSTASRAATGSGIGSMLAPGVRSRTGVDTAQRSLTAQAPQQAQATTPQAIQTPTAEVPGFGTPTVNLTEYEYPTPTATTTGPPSPDSLLSLQLPSGDRREDEETFGISGAREDVIFDFRDPLTGDVLRT